VPSSKTAAVLSKDEAGRISAVVAEQWAIDEDMWK
jgi:hypothetical protein